MSGPEGRFSGSAPVSSGDAVGRSGTSRVPGGSVAAVDCGTNSTRLLVADARGRTLSRLMEITRLGEGVDRTGLLSAEAIKRTTEVLTSYRRVMDDVRVKRARLVATSALRDAANADEALAALHEASGIEPEVLSGQEEGRLSFLGATAELDPAEGARLVADIGGGSTELAFGQDASDLEVLSLDVGCVRVTERFLVHDPPRPGEIEGARHVVGTMVEQERSQHPRLGSVSEMIGLAGTVSALAQMGAGAREYDRSVVHHARLGRQQVGEMLAELASEDLQERSRRPAMEPGRADVIVGGTLVLDVLMDTLGLESCLVSESDILDGLVLTQLGERLGPRR